MKIALTAVAPRRSKDEATERLFADYVERAGRYAPCESQVFGSEAALLEWLDRQAGRSAAYAILLDSRGQQSTSEEIAATVGRLRDDGTQRIVFAIGPADGWSAVARKRANLLLSLGVLRCRISWRGWCSPNRYNRALSILAGHPYHSGH